MDSSTHQSYRIQNNQLNPGLLRFRSAPTSLLSNPIDTLDCGVNYGDLQQSYIDSSYELLGMHHHSSSLPGLASNLSVHNGYGSMNRLKYRISFSTSQPPYSPSMLSRISEIGNEGTGANNDSDEAPIRYSSWNDSAIFTENFSGSKRTRDDDQMNFFSSNQDVDAGSGVRNHVLSHHSSMPRTSNEMVGMGKFLHFQDSTHCKMRAKRGCATHPRSIAERVRRTRISERMRKLQELVPNMDNQTNTADMLDLAVEYIKDLQKQFKILSDNLVNCKCLNIQKSVSNQIV